MEVIMKELRRLLSHTLLDVGELGFELAKRVTLRTGWYKKALKKVFDRADMPLTDSLLNSLVEEEIDELERIINAALLASHEAVERGDGVRDLLHDFIIWGRKNRRAGEGSWKEGLEESWMEWAREKGAVN